MFISTEFQFIEFYWRYERMRLIYSKGEVCGGGHIDLNCACVSLYIVICSLIAVTKCIHFFSNVVKFEDLTVLTMKSVVFLDMTRYNPVQIYRYTYRGADKSLARPGSKQATFPWI